MQHNCTSFTMRINLTAFFLILSPALWAQQRDAGLWISASFEKRLTKKLTGSLSQEVRFNENISEAGTVFTETGIDYSFAKRWSAGLSYRFIQQRTVTDFYSIRHRLMADVAYRIRFKSFTLVPRLRYQLQYRDIHSSENGKIPDKYLRMKLTARYDFGKRYTPFISSEFFYRMDIKESFIDNIRYQAGFDYELSKFHSLSFFYMLNKEIQVNAPVTEYNLGAGYRFRF